MSTEKDKAIASAVLALKAASWDLRRERSVYEDGRLVERHGMPKTTVEHAIDALAKLIPLLH